MHPDAHRSISFARTAAVSGRIPRAAMTNARKMLPVNPRIIAITPEGSGISLLKMPIVPKITIERMIRSLAPDMSAVTISLYFNAFIPFFLNVIPSCNFSMHFFNALF
jgi:hypothetical protein